MDFNFKELLDAFSKCQSNDLVKNNEKNNLINLFREYNKEDIYCAAFCLSSWRYNRPHLVAYLTVNAAVIDLKTFGNKELKDYNDFKQLVDKINDIVSFEFEDEIICDFGEIKIQFKDKFYPVFVGTGNNFLIPFYENLDILSDRLNIRNEINQCLDYYKSIVDSYGKACKFDSNIEHSGRFSLPSKEYYEFCYRTYSSLKIEEKSILRIFANDKITNYVKVHFIFDSDSFYPVFNPTLIVDAFSYLYELRNPTSSDILISLSDSILYNSLVSNFNIDPSHEIVLERAAILLENEKDIVNDSFMNMAIIFDNKVIFFINQNEFNDRKIDSFLKNAERLKKRNRLFMAVPEEYPKLRKYDLNDYNITFVVYGGNTNIETTYFVGGKCKCLYLYEYDLISIAYQAKSVQYFVDFLSSDYKKLLGSRNMYSGLSSLFDAWQMQNMQISQGALEFSNVLTDVYAVEQTVFEKFNDLEKWYPFNKANYMFNNPFSWNTRDDLLGFKRIYSKAENGACGDIKKFNNKYFFLFFNMNFEINTTNLNQRSEFIKLIEELNCRLFNQFGENILKSINIDFDELMISYLPFEYAVSIDNVGFTKKKSNFVYSDSFKSENILCIRFTVKEKELLEAVQNAKDKSVECIYLEELLSCLQKYFNNYKLVIDEIRKHQKDKKDIKMFSVELEYFFSNRNLGLWPSDDVFVKVRKDIAISCKKQGIKPGIYNSDEATVLIRTIQDLIITKFEEMLTKYSKYDLHIKLMSILAYNYHYKRLDGKRYGIFDDDSLNDSIKDVSMNNIISNREETKHRIRTINYIIDTNLSLNHTGNNTAFDLEYLLAYANWLIVLQDCADQCHYNLFDAKIELESDYKVNTLYPDEHDDIALAHNRRVYNNEEYMPKLSNSKDYYSKSLDCFLDDTGVGLPFIISVCLFLSKEFSATFPKSIYPDVFEIKYDDLLADCKSVFVNQSEKNLKMIEDAFDYLIIDETKIKTLGNENQKFVPIWDREKRIDRIETKPLVKNGDKIIFSPLSVYELAQIWRSGSTMFFPPYEYGLNKYMKSLDKWKDACEKQMEKNIEDLFKSKGMNAWRGLKLHKIDKYGNHPQELGDYDVVAIDSNKKIVWNIESKFLNRIGSLKEYYNHQDSFFNKNKKDEKFSRRIKYLSENLETILIALGIADVHNYSIRNFMVTNKVFSSQLKKIDFDIITFFELKEILELNKKD